MRNEKCSNSFKVFQFGNFWRICGRASLLEGVPESADRPTDALSGSHSISLAVPTGFVLYRQTVGWLVGRTVFAHQHGTAQRPAWAQGLWSEMRTFYTDTSSYNIVLYNLRIRVKIYHLRPAWAPLELQSPRGPV